MHLLDFVCYEPGASTQLFPPTIFCLMMQAHLQACKERERCLPGILLEGMVGVGTNPVVNAQNGGGVIAGVDHRLLAGRDGCEVYSASGSGCGLPELPSLL